MFIDLFKAPTTIKEAAATKKVLCIFSLFLCLLSTPKKGASNEW
jgi:hypothetical protein